jgi:hypothetical protein
MSTEPIKRFTVATNEFTPIEFEVADANDKPLGVFRITRRPRLDMGLAIAQAVVLEDGKRQYNSSVILWLLNELMIQEEQNEAGEWVPADDRERFAAIMQSDRYSVDWVLLGEIIQWLNGEITGGFPTIASSESSDGRTANDTGSKVNSDSVA